MISPGFTGYGAPFFHARFFNSSNRFTFAARQMAVLTLSQSRVGPD
jgi:hypothetical protein